MNARAALRTSSPTTPATPAQAARLRVIQFDSLPETERRILSAFLAVAKAPTATQAQAARVGA